MERYGHYWTQSAPSKARGRPSQYPPKLYAHEPNIPGEGYFPEGQPMVKDELDTSEPDVYGFLDISGVAGPSSGYPKARMRHAASASPRAHHQDDDSIKSEDGPAMPGGPSQLFRAPSPLRDTTLDAETEAYLRSTLNIPHHTPLDLYALPEETVTKPSISSLIRLAIWGSPSKRLTLKQIYEAIERRYPSWKGEKDKPWQRSIRHNLSLKAIYRNVDRPAGDPGKGNYWELDVKKGETNKRPRHRTGRDSSSTGSHGSASEPDSEDDGQSSSSSHSYQAHSSTYSLPRQNRSMPVARSLPNSAMYPSNTLYSVDQPFDGGMRTQFSGPFNMTANNPRPYNEMTLQPPLPNYLHGYHPQSAPQPNQNAIITNSNLPSYSSYAHQDAPFYPNFMAQGTSMDMEIPFLQDPGYSNRTMGTSPEIIPYMSEAADGSNTRPSNRRRRSDSLTEEDEQRRVRNFPPSRRNFG